MNTRERLAELLENAGDRFVSGSALAEELGLTRAAVWKNIKLLTDSGWKIESETAKGYRLSPENDTLSVLSVRRALGERAERFPLEVLEETTSTNDYLKQRAAGLPDRYTVIADHQTGGRGRYGHSFYSPCGTGIYLSLLLRPVLPAQEAVRITAAVAVAACRALEKCTDSVPAIKWVNDIFTEGGKTCGILTEASINMETGLPDWIVTGIGFNIYEPEGGFPPELADIVGFASRERKGGLRSRIAAAFLTELDGLCEDLMSPALVEEYRQRSFLLGRAVTVRRAGKEIAARVLDIDDECRLVVRTEDGKRDVLSSGEVSVRPMEDGTLCTDKE